MQILVSTWETIIFTPSCRPTNSIKVLKANFSECHKNAKCSKWLNKQKTRKKRFQKMSTKSLLNTDPAQT